MALIYIIAGAPWGPVKLGWANHAGALLDRVRSAPAHVEDIGNRDAEQVIAAACANLPAADPMGLILTSTQKAARAVKEAAWAVSAMVVATKSAEVAARPRNSDPGGSPTGGEGDATTACPAAGVMTNDDIEPRARAADRKRLGAEVYVREVRLGLKMTQSEFAKAFGLGVATVRDWEQGRTEPDGAARSLLMVISRRPDAVREALAGYGDSVAA